MEDPITRPVLAAGFFVGDTPHLAVGAQKLFNRLQEPSQPQYAMLAPRLACLLEVVALRQLALPEVSDQRKHYLRLEREQLLTSVVIPTDEPLVERPTWLTFEAAKKKPRRSLRGIESFRLIPITRPDWTKLASLDSEVPTNPYSGHSAVKFCTDS